MGSNTISIQTIQYYQILKTRTIMKQFLLKLTDEDKKKLEELARAEYITQSAYIRRQYF